MSNKKEIIYIGVILSVLFLIVFLSTFSIAVEPFGANVTVLNVSTAPADAAGSANAFAGNISELAIKGYSTTQTWQGYFGNITGTIQLADSNDYVMYNWTLASPQGEIYASTNSSIQWPYIQCFNFTANGTYNSDVAQAGSTSLYGTNLSQLETMFNLNYSAVDGVDETFTFSGPGTHDLFTIANLQFGVGECRSTRVFGSSGPTADLFEEALLYEPQTTSIVFASIIEMDGSAFKGGTSDFEMLVLEDGHGTDVSVTPYYFFVGIQ